LAVRRARQRRPLKPTLVLGQYGMLLIRYVGPYNGTIKGPMTGHKYPVRKDDRRSKYADVRDVPGLMQMTDGDGNLLFRKG